MAATPVSSLTVAAAVVVAAGVGVAVCDSVGATVGVLVALAVGLAGDPHDTTSARVINGTPVAHRRNLITLRSRS
jgi:hypothetical protein